MTTTRATARYGWRRDLPDPRDLLYHETLEAPVSLPGAVDLSPRMPAIYDQGQLGSCTGNGIARVLEYQQIAQGEPQVTPSRLFIYYEERVIEGTTSQDSGAQIRDGIKVVASEGAPPEADWPYDVTQFAVKPPQVAYDDAKLHEAIRYHRIVVGSPGAPMRSALAQGLPIVFGFSVPSSFEDGTWDPASGQPLPLPDPGIGFIGGHCVVITGYDFVDGIPYFQCDNSWGAAWGMGGRFRMDYRYFDPTRQLADDLWVIQRVS